jgi:hypothetical protein
MNPNWIKSNTRPNIDELDEMELLDIIMKYDGSWYNLKHTRLDMVNKVLQLWKEYALYNYNDKSLEPINND